MARRRHNNNKGGGKPYEQRQNTISTKSTGKGGESGSTEEHSNENGQRNLGDERNTNIPSAKNDPEWYDRDHQLNSDACRIPFSLPFGGQFDLHKGFSVGPGSITFNIQNSANAAGICTLRLKPSLGVNGGKSSPANVCANALYTHVRYMNSGRKNYDDADLFMYVAAFGDIYSFINWCIRMYNYAFMYSQRNWYIGKDLLMENGMDPASLVSNLANFRYWINSIINKVSSFCLPGDIYYFKRRVFMYANYYVENGKGNLKDQLYQFVPDGFFAFDYDSNQAGKLAYHKWDYTVAHNYLDLQSFFETVLMYNITGDEDFGLMSGDIRKAYGDNIMYLRQIPEDGGLLPVYDEYVLSQFKNAVIMDVSRQDSTAIYYDHLGNTHILGDVEQSNDGLIESCEGFKDWSLYKGSAAWAAGNHILNVDNPEPNEGDVVEATRLMPHLGLIPSTGGAYQYVINGGTEIAVAMSITYRPSPDGITVYRVTYPNLVLISQANMTSTLNLSYLVHAIQFKYAPIVYLYHVDTSGGGNVVDWFLPVANLENATTVNNANLQRIHEVALLSLFYVPGVAKLA